MASTTVYFSGTSKWAKLNKPDEKYTPQWMINILYTDIKDTFDASGLRMEPKTDKQDGLEYITFKRPVTKQFGKELVTFEKPQVIDPKGNAVTDLIGNGSKVTAKVTVFDTVHGKGHRLESVRVDELIKYEKKDSEASASVTSGSKPVNGLPF